MNKENFKLASRIILIPVCTYGALRCVDYSIGLAKEIPNYPFENKQFGKIDGETCFGGTIALAVCGAYLARKTYQLIVG